MRKRTGRMREKWRFKTRGILLAGLFFLVGKIRKNVSAYLPNWLSHGRYPPQKIHCRIFPKMVQF